MRRFGSNQWSAHNSTYEDMRRAFDTIKTKLANTSSSMISVDPGISMQNDNLCSDERSACDFTLISSDEESCSNTLISIGPEARNAIFNSSTVCSKASADKVDNCIDYIESNSELKPKHTSNKCSDVEYTSNKYNNTEYTNSTSSNSSNKCTNKKYTGNAEYTSNKYSNANNKYDDNQEKNINTLNEEKTNDCIATRQLIHEESLSDEMDYKELGFLSFINMFNEEDVVGIEAQQIDNITFRKARGEVDETSHSQMHSEDIYADIQHLKRIRFDQMPKDVRKIGEATFSEVFAHGTLVYKIIPLGNSSEETCIKSFLKESSIFQTICKEEGVCKLVDVFLLNGRYSEEYLRAWDEYGEEENERPCKYNDEQEYGVLVMADGGVSLEDTKFTNCAEINRFLKNVAKVLANLETKYEFEHRDLHWGNILINSEKVNLIDFSLSRIKSNGKVIYEDLNAKEWLFEGDEQTDIQFGVYKQMRLLSHSDWKAFIPESNVLWMKYLVQKAFSKIRFRGRSSLISQYIKIMDSSSSMIEAEQKLSKCTKIQ
ncbi:haspin serine/threonine kinase [Ordospora colligata]|nr:haspin serine/threonine kinase [Ordospora colligata]